MSPRIRLRGVPVVLFLRAAEHQAELLREVSLIHLGDQTGVTHHTLHTRLYELCDELHNRFSRPATEIRAQFERAAAQGRETIDIELPGAPLAADLTEALTDLLDEADEFCRAGHLLTLPADPEVVAWWHWWRGEVLGQIRDGRPPRRYRAAAAH